MGASIKYLKLQHFAHIGACGLCVLAIGTLAHARNQVPQFQNSGMRWRNIGPFRGGRVSAVSGVIGQPGTFYIGLPMGGVWKTTDAGITWNPIFDAVRSVSSIGSVAVAPSDPNVVYVGTGDMIVRGICRGNGMWKSVDAGKTWHHIGLDGTNQIPSLLVDEHNPNIVLVAAQGPINKKSPMRGVFRSTDGGKTWTRTLYVDSETGAVKLAWDPNHPQVILATTDAHYRKPGALPFFMRGKKKKKPIDRTKLYESLDEGITWKRITGGGLPPLNGRTCVAIAMHTHDQRMFLVQNAGLWQSNNGGKNWVQMDKQDPRVRNGQGGYNCGVYVNTMDPNTVYVINTSSYISRDDGKTFTGFKGAPGGDDPQQMWIDPTDGNCILLGMDQGATVSLNGGKTWSLWYNQPTGQYYHISTDNQTPFWVYGTEQDSGSIGTSSRGILGEITPLDWSTNPGYEFGYIVADPLHPNITYAGGPSSGIVKGIFPSGQWTNVSPNAESSLHLRHVLNQPLVFSQTNPHELFAGFQYLMATTDGGLHWKKLSPDLTHPKGWKPPVPGAKKTPKHEKPATQKSAEIESFSWTMDPDLMPEQGPFDFGSIECIAPSPHDGGVIWVGTSNGLIKLTRNGGGSWQDVSIPKLPFGNRANISSIDVSPFNPGEAYVAVDAHNMGDYAPYFYRTTDYGKSWVAIDKGLATHQVSGSFSRVIRCDDKAPGLLFAGTESSVYYSINNGNTWHSLRLNLPNTSYRDLVVHGNDLVAGTYGRAIWILDDISPLRHLAQWTQGEPTLFQPETAIRVRRNVGQDTPFPPEVPHGDNPPQGAILDYSLPIGYNGNVTLTIKDAKGAIVRTLSSLVAPPAGPKYPPEPNFWLAKRTPIPATPGFHRVTWDLRYPMPPSLSHSYEINANPGETLPSPRGPLVIPGKYTVTFSAGGNSETAPLLVKNDPRSPGSFSSIRKDFAIEMGLYRRVKQADKVHLAILALRAKVAQFLKANPKASTAKAMKAFDKKLATLDGAGGRRFFFFFRRQSGPPPPPNFMQLIGAMNNEMQQLDTSDVAPSQAMIQNDQQLEKNLVEAMSIWKKLQTKEEPTFKQELKLPGSKA